ncbi:MAG: hypothetical protein WC713_02015 [Candidatus Methylomirabilota bacterium]
MANLRFRTSRMQVLARLCPMHATAEERQEFVATIDRRDEEGVVAFLARHPADPAAQRLLEVCRQARQVADRLNLLDRTLPALPHSEICACYETLRSLERDIASL